MDKFPPKPIGESCFLRNSGISKWYKQHWYETIHRFHPSSFESTPSCWQIPWGVGQGHLPQHCYAQASDWWESPQCMIYCMLKVSFWSNYTEVWLMSLNVNQISFGFWTLEVGEPSSFHWIECFQPSRLFSLSQGSIIPWWLLLQHLVFSTLATDPTGRSRWLILATGWVNSTGSVWPHFHGRYGHHVNIYRNISEGAPNWGPWRNLVLKQPLFHQKLQALGYQQGLPILVHRYLGIGWYRHWRSMHEDLWLIPWWFVHSDHCFFSSELRFLRQASSVKCIISQSKQDWNNISGF